MKKILVLIILFIIFLSNASQNDFTLLDYFDGEYIAYTTAPKSKTSISLGTCYMNYDMVENDIIGESMTIYNFEISSAIKVLDATIIKTEVLSNGTNVIYCYTEKIPTNIEMYDTKVNLQIADNHEYTVIGWPLILGSF